MNERIPLNQLSNLMKWLVDEDKHKDHLSIFDLSNRDDVYERLSKMSYKQYKYIFFLLGEKSWFKIKEILSKFLIIK